MENKKEYSLFGTWSIEDTKAIGKKFKARCKSNWSYERQLTIGKEYIIEIVEPILALSPLCDFIGDNEKLSGAHLQRFEKIGDV